jgi:diguanylate cyclase (GGDEF)-like protein
LRSKIVWLVLLASFVCTLIPCLLWTVATHNELQRHFDEAGPVVLGRSTERVRARLHAARSEIEQIGLAYGGGGRIEEAKLQEALGASESFSALLVLDPAGNLLGVAGSGPALESLLAMLDAKSSLDSGLMTVMQGAQLRKQLGSFDALAIRVLDAPDQPPLPVAGMPLRDPRGKAVATLQGLVKRDEIAAALRTDLLGVRAHAYLADAEGHVVAANGLGGEIEPEHFGGTTDFLTGLLDVVSRGWSLRYEAPLDFLNWTVVIEASVLEAFQPLALTLVLALVLPPTLALGFGLIALWSATRMASPLWTLYASMRQAARDQALNEVEVGHASGEAESLIQAFNLTIRQLQHNKLQAERNTNALREQNQAFQQQHESLSKLTVTDPLTQLANRRFFENQLKLEIKRLSRHGQGLSMLVIDVDDFKKLNDTLGHTAGDEFLRQIARILKETLRATDLAARYGGEEFVVVATGTTLQGAVVLAEKIRTAVAEASFIVDSSMRPRRVTISVGVAEYRGSQTDLFNSADAALYEAKSAGKNCVVASGAERNEDSG